MRKIRKFLSPIWMGRQLKWKIRKFNNQKLEFSLMNLPSPALIMNLFNLKSKMTSLWKNSSKTRWRTDNQIMSLRSKKKDLILWSSELRSLPSIVSLLKKHNKMEIMPYLAEKKMMGKGKISKPLKIFHLSTLLLFKTWYICLWVSLCREPQPFYLSSCLSKRPSSSTLKKS